MNYRLDTTFSIYVEMERQLRQDFGWKPISKGSNRFKLLMGDRFNIKYQCLLGEEVIGCKQLVNYFSKTHMLTLKSAMVRRIREFYEQQPDWLSQSFILTKPKEDNSPVDDSNLPPWKRSKRPSKDMQQSAEDLTIFSQIPNDEKNWILKPSSGCGGQGIFISSSPSEIIKRVNESKSESIFIAQQYIPNPLLLDGGRKFDLRVWVLLIHPFEIYVFTEGSLRTSSYKYDTSDLTNLKSHITNHCLQEQCPDYGKYEEGNEMWYSEFDDWVKKTHPGVDNALDSIRSQTSIVIKETLSSVEDLIALPHSDPPYLPFQLFGYDFLVDSDFKVWLLEINGSPASAEKWKKDLVRDMIALAVDNQIERDLDKPHFEKV